MGSGERQRGRRTQRTQRARLRLLTRWAKASAQNALEVVRVGRLGPAYVAPYEVVDQGPHHRLRRYRRTGAPSASAGPSTALGPLVLVPPLMLTAEIYDVSPELSAVSLLLERGVDVFVVDFGAPESAEGGMRRTLTDHVRAVARCVEHVRARAGRDVHLGGYSQGGMFAYQAAAFLRSEGLASVITFGSPVDIHRSLPAVHEGAFALVSRAVRPALDSTLARIEGLPGKLTSVSFKLLTPRKEIGQLVDFVRSLHDRDALAKRESRRRFLGGEGFVAWPGPALREFVEQFIVENRMVSGGIVIDGRTVTLADIRCPILCFVGTRDDIARAPSVRAIARAATSAPLHEVSLDAGHFGLVVGSRAMTESWPAVVEWLAFSAGRGPEPRLLTREREARVVDDEPEGAGFDVDVDYDLLGDVVRGTAEAAWRKVGDALGDVSDTIAHLRFRVPRLVELERIEPGSAISAAAALARQARAIPDKTFFLWNGRAFTYADADRRVGHVARGLLACGVRPAARVAVLMGGRPSFLSMVTALNRIGAVAVIVDPNLADEQLPDALALAGAEMCATDPDNLARARRAHAGPVLVLGGGSAPRELGHDVVDMEAIDPERVELPPGLVLDAAVAADLALVLVSRGPDERLRAAPVTNHRWALSAVGAAAACTLRPEDTVYCCLPLHHPAGVLVSVGSALVGGSRLALAPRFDPQTFWVDVRRYGATVAFYAGEMARALVASEPSAADRRHPLRLLAGSGMRPDLWARVKDRFGVGVLEFYASTTQNLVLANASGAKLGALGRPLPGSDALAVVRFDLATGEPERDAAGHLVPCAAGEPGIALVAIGGGVRSEGYGHRAGRVLVDGADRWLVSGDVLRRDADGDFWFVERLSGYVRTAGGVVSTRAVEQALYAIPEVELCAAYGLSDPGAPGREQVVASFVSRRPLDGARLAAVATELSDAELPRHLRHVDAIVTNDGFRPLKPRLREAGLAPGPGVTTWRWDAAAHRYVPLAE